MYDVVALGELLIDFTPAGISPNGNVMFERNPGGAPGNVLAMISKLGGKTAFIGKVGEDQFGHYLKDVMDGIGIDTESITFTNKANTTLAFVHLNNSGDRSFSFYRNPGADMLLEISDLNEKILRNTRIFHYGTVSMTNETSKEATNKAVMIAKESGAVISFDPNLRPPLWRNLNYAKETMIKCLEYTDILKLSGEELEFITGYTDLDKGTDRIYQSYGIPIILITLGPAGCYFRISNLTGRVKTYDLETIDTTGAGDAFVGAFLYKFIEMNKEAFELQFDEVRSMVDFANAAGSLVTTKKGAIPAIPSVFTVETCIKTVKRLEI